MLVPTEAELARAEGRSFEPTEEMLARVKIGTGLDTTQKPAKTRRRAQI